MTNLAQSNYFFDSPTMHKIKLNIFMVHLFLTEMPELNKIEKENLVFSLIPFFSFGSMKRYPSFQYHSDTTTNSTTPVLVPTTRTTGERKFSHVVLSRLRLDIAFLWPTSIIKCLSQAIYISNVFRNKTENSNPKQSSSSGPPSLTKACMYPITSCLFEELVSDLLYSRDKECFCLIMP